MKQQQSGFTLLEVMIAVAVLAMALTSLVKLNAQSIQNMSYLERKTYAMWVAQNQLSEVLAKGQRITTGRSQGKAEMAGVSWWWEMVVTETAVEQLQRVELRVKQQEKGSDPLYRLIAFTQKPA